MEFQCRKYNYSERTGNLKAEAVGRVKGEKHFPVFNGNLVFKPLTKSKPYSTPMFAYAEVFWSRMIDRYFIPAPQYELALCRGYEQEAEKYYDYGTIVPMIYGEHEHLMNLLEFFRKNKDEKVDIDNYLNYCQMFYDYTSILDSAWFQNHPDFAEQLAMQILISILKGDQNYHYENVAFLCDDSGRILKMAPMIDHEFSTYFMFPDDLNTHYFWLDKLHQSIEASFTPGEYDYLTDPEERRLMENSSVCLNRNLLYIKEHFPETVRIFLADADILKNDLLTLAADPDPAGPIIQKCPDYPDYANSYAYHTGIARYKEHDEEKARQCEQKYGKCGEAIDFPLMSGLILQEILQTIHKMTRLLK